MSPAWVTLDDLPIYEEDLFLEAGIELLPLAKALVQCNHTRFTRFPHSKGIARIVNLLEWESHAYHEFLDGEGIFADQVVHVAIHQAVDKMTGGRHPENMLLAEALASSSDVYLIGQLSRAGCETDFLAETLESLGSYFEMYGEGESQLAAFLEQVLARPFETMVAVSDYLYEFCMPLLYPDSVSEMAAQLRELERQPFYPLIHHYNTTNWILTIRATYPQWYPDSGGTAEVRKQLCGDEAHFLAAFRELVLDLRA